MERERLNLDVSDFRLSSSKHHSDAGSVEKNERLKDSQFLDKSLFLDSRLQKSPFFLSMELESSKEFQINPFVVQTTPVQNTNKSFLSSFSRRFDSLRRIATEEEPFENSLNLSLMKNEQKKEEKDLLATSLIFNEKKSTSSKITPINSDSKQDLDPTQQAKEEADLNSSCHSNSNSNSHISDRNSDDFNPFQVKKLTSNKRKPNFKHLHNVYFVCHQMFSTGSLTTESYRLLDWEEDILNCLIHRKYFYKMTPTETMAPADEKVQKINEILSSRSNKRPEECYKFILTRIIKNLKRNFGAKPGQSLEESERSFYHYYFAEVAAEMSLNLENFYYPITRKQLDKIKLNSQYFDKIFKSKRFLNDTFNYLDNVLREEYQEELKQKLRTFLNKYDLMLRRNPDKREETLRKIKDYLLKNKRCKLPWTVREINEAVERFRILFDHFRTAN
jgi:hypothetical protein